MKGKEARSVMDTIENEGFAYTFFGYTNFDEIDDEEFHKLREAFLKAGRELADYVGYEECIS